MSFKGFRRGLIYKYLTQKMLESGLEEIKLQADYYWMILPNDRENFTKIPEPCVGSLIDDWKELKNNINAKRITNLDLDRFANILIAISEVAVKNGTILLPEE